MYIDDIILCSNSHTHHLELLKAVFKRFEKYNLKCKSSEVQLGTGEVNYLGYNISQMHGIRPGEAKVQAVKNRRAITNLTEIRQFLGLCSFFRCTIPHFSTIANPLTKLTRKESQWTSSPLPPEAQAAFMKLKMLL